MPIPEFDPATDALPAGIHEATWPEVAARFGGNDRRNALLRGLRLALRTLANAGCIRVYLGGSFVAAKAAPSDWDGCYEPLVGSKAADGNPGPRTPSLGKAIATGDKSRMVLLYGGEIYSAADTTNRGDRFIDFFQIDRQLRPVGIVAIDLATLE